MFEWILVYAYKQGLARLQIFVQTIPLQIINIYIYIYI